MGKARRSRGRGNRADPIAKPVKLPSDPELLKVRETTILPVLNALKNPDPKSRTGAAGAIANIVQDARCRKLLLREQVVTLILSETLTDSSIDSRAAGWKVLTVLAEEEAPDFCVHLHRLDVLTAIEHASKTILETLTATEPAFSKLHKAQQRVVWDITSSLVTILGLLALARNEILAAIVGNQTILRLLFRLAATDIAPQELYEEAMSCLTTLSEDNIQLGQAVTSDQETRCFDVLLKLASGTDLKAVLSCGVLHNVFTSLSWLDHSPGPEGACDAVIVASLSRALEQVTPSNASSSHAGIAQLALEILASIGTDFQQTLEKGNRAPSGPAEPTGEWNGFDDGDADAMDVDAEPEADGEKEEPEGEGEDEDDEEDDNDSVTSDMEADIDLVTGEEGSGAADLNLPTLAGLIQEAVPQLIRLSNIPVNSEETLAIQSHALSALNNIAWTIACLEFAQGENAGIFNAWYPTAKKIWRKTIAPILEADSADLKLATQVTGLAWAVARTLNGETPADGTQHRKFISLYHASKHQSQQTESGQADSTEDQDPFQGLGVKCIGVLGSMARDPAPLEVNREVGVFLMTLLGGGETAAAQTAVPVAETVEVLNQLFDLYGDEEVPCDKEVFWKDGFLKHLEEFVPKMKALARGVDKRSQAELRTRADEASMNLARFVLYKKKYVPK
ncbi:hypothetical protein C8A05DRAFT_11400 [Staphylotrichum tortipilum]|uniref:SYO1-like TPR repeats domain-containing protein n=1 Tax=Staphylotrichum tortipilum TaxID=2831512 RepID=A0AAN6RXW1_9PEZI|nr:hypothetical protein C8A05DRAFT_11400 [Staphylotrichum longicolle]